MNQGTLIRKQRLVALPYALLGASADVPVPYGMQRMPAVGQSGYLEDFATDVGMFLFSAPGSTIGKPGTVNFGIASDYQQQPYLLLRHVQSLSVVNDVPSQDEITQFTDIPRPDPFADSTASGFTFNSVAFPIPEDGYSIGTPGALHFGIAFDLDEEEAIIDPIHTASLSVM